jgi:hypothetical protein
VSINGIRKQNLATIHPRPQQQKPMNPQRQLRIPAALMFAVHALCTATAAPLAAPGPIDSSNPDVSIVVEIHSPTSLLISWGEVEGSHGYRLQRRVGLSGSWTPIAETPHGITSFLDSNLSSTDLYYYRAAGRNADGEIGAYTPTVQGTTVPVPYTFYTDRAQFQAAAGPLVTEGFNTRFTSADKVDFGSFVADAEFGTVKWANGTNSPSLVSEGAGSLYGFDLQPPSTGNGITFTFDNRIHCFGIDIVDLSSGLSVSSHSINPPFPWIRIAEQGPMPTHFFGVISEQPFYFIHFHWGKAQESVGLDHLQYSASLPVPRLTIVPAGSGQATISWRPHIPGFRLQETATFSPANWDNSPSGTTNPVTVPLTRGRKFYRISRP